MKFVVVYDSSCGGCSSLAAGLSTVLSPRPLIRSCRDPHLTAEFAISVEHPCGRPFTITVADDGSARVRHGLGMLLGTARLVKARRWPAAVRLGARFLWLRLRHTAE